MAGESINVLIIGGGGREHALAKAVAASPKLGQLFCLPGNAGTASIGTNLDIDPNDHDAIVAVVRDRGIGFTIVGPEAPLCAGIVDRFKEEGLSIFGPSKAAARLEGDKAFAKELMTRALIPTAEARIFDKLERAKSYIATRDSALVVKASGLASGKGVIVCEEPYQALLAVEQIMAEGQFGDAGSTVLIEERLQGTEMSVLALIDDRTVYVLETVQDYKRIGDHDEGPNTGGMGAVSPSPHATNDLLDQVQRDIIIPTLDGLRREGTVYRGVLYVGLMLTAGGPKVLEFNCRFGDPEAQVLLPRIKSDVLELLLACAEGRLEEATIEWDTRTAVCVVMASEGYPGSYQTGLSVEGLESPADDVTIYHAGTESHPPKILTSGGRVLGVTALGENAATARAKAYETVNSIRFRGATFRNDIASGM